MTDDECPFHDLPAEQTIYVELDGGVPMPYSAGYACSEYHLAVSMAPVMDAGLRAAMEWMDSFAPSAELPACYRKVTS